MQFSQFTDHVAGDRIQIDNNLNYRPRADVAHVRSPEAELRIFNLDQLHEIANHFIMKNVTIRRAEALDAGPLSQCIEAAYSVYSSRIADLPPVSDGIAQTIERSRVWIAEADSGIVGGIVLTLHEKFMMLENVAVHPDNSGMGIGAALIRQAEVDCLESGLHELRLSTHIDMPENIRLYEHLGWQETERSGNKVLMSKNI